MADRSADRKDSEIEPRNSEAKINWLDLELQSADVCGGSAAKNSAMLESSCQGSSHNYRDEESYRSDNDQLAADRKYINYGVDHLAELGEKGLGFAIGSWGIWAEKFRGSGKYLSKFEYKVNLTPTPSARQAEKLDQVKSAIEHLTFAGRSTGAAVLKKEQEELEKMILQRSKVISSSGLAAGMLGTQAVDQLIFRNDSPGDGTFCADVIASPALAWMVPRNIALKTGAILGAHLIGKLYDRWLQPVYIYDSKDENHSTFPTIEVNQFRSPFALLSKTSPVERLSWPTSYSPRGDKSNFAGTEFVFTSDDFETQLLNKERQRRNRDQ